MTITPLISENEISHIVSRMAQQVAQQHPAGEGQPLLLIALLKGSFIFAADLARALYRQGVAVECDFLGLSSYGDGTETSGKVTLTQDLSTSPQGRNILLVDDILESGLSMHYARNLCKERGAKAVEIAVFLEKPGKRRTEINPHYVGQQIDDHFVIGYGLDYAGRYRELPYIGIWQGKA